MGINYKVFVFDDHLGMLNGRTATEEADFLTNLLKKEGVNFDSPFRYNSDGRCLIADFRKWESEDV